MKKLPAKQQALSINDKPERIRNAGHLHSMFKVKDLGLYYPVWDVGLDSVTLGLTLENAVPLLQYLMAVLNSPHKCFKGQVMTPTGSHSFTWNDPLMKLEKWEVHDDPFITIWCKPTNLTSELNILSGGSRF